MHFVLTGFCTRQSEHQIVAFGRIVWTTVLAAHAQVAEHLDVWRSRADRGGAHGSHE